MKVKKLIILTLTMLIILTIIPIVSATFEKPNFQNGDYWNYAYYVSVNNTEYEDYSETNDIEYIIGGFSIEITGSDTISVDGKTYDVIMVNESTFVIDNETGNFSFISGVTKFLKKDNLALVKEIQYDIYSEDYFELTYIPPLDEFEYPIKTGEIWEPTALMKDLFDNSTDTIVYNYECLQEQQLELTEVNDEKNVTYNCHVIELITPAFNETYIVEDYWMSSEVGNYVYAEEYYLDDSNELIEVFAYMELISFSYTPPATKKTPGFESAMAFMALTAVALLWVHKKRKY